MGDGKEREGEMEGGGAGLSEYIPFLCVPTRNRQISHSQFKEVFKGTLAKEF